MTTQLKSFDFHSSVSYFHLPIMPIIMGASTTLYILVIATSVCSVMRAWVPSINPTSHAADVTGPQFLTPSTSPVANDFMGDFANTFKGLHWWWKVLILILFSGLITWSYSCLCCRSLNIYYRPTSRHSQAQLEERPNGQSTSQAQVEERPNEHSTSQVQTEEEPNGQSPSQAQTFSTGFLHSPGEPLSASDLSPSRNGGAKVRVAYQGVPGSYSEDAALKAYPNCETVPCEGFEAAFKAVELWLVDRAVIPIENSVAGSIHRNYDLLLRHRLHIVGEVQLDVNHCLMGLPGVRKEDLKCVLSHPQALDQCESTLSKLGLTRINVDDAAGAAQIVASDWERDTGAVASARAAAIYGLNILEERIQDDEDNITRFMILAREPVIPGTDRPYKTSIVFSFEEGPGVLFKALAAFSLRNINLTKIESRPQRKRPLRIVDDSNKGSPKYFDYLFYIDFQASMAEPRAQFALGHLQEFASFLRVLGSYPMDCQ